MATPLFVVVEFKVIKYNQRIIRIAKEWEAEQQDTAMQEQKTALIREELASFEEDDRKKKEAREDPSYWF